MRQRAFALAVIIICFTAAYASAISLRIATTSSGSDAGATVADTAADTEVLVGSGAGTAAWVAMSGDATIANTGAVTVANESHDHTTTTLSGIDISADTNLSGTSPIVLSGDAVTLDQTAEFNLTNTANDFIAATLKGNTLTTSATTSDGTDNSFIAFAGGGAFSVTRGALVSLLGNEHATAPGHANIYSGGSATAKINFFASTISSSTPIFYLDGDTGNLVWGTDNADDIGVSGGNKPRSIFVGTSVTSPIFSSSNADPADTGLLRGGNAENLVCAEVSPAGTDQCISLDSDEKWNFGTSNVTLESPLHFNIEVADTRIIRLQEAGTTRWQFDGSNANEPFGPAAGNAYDLGTAQNPVKSLYLQTSIQAANSKTLTEASATSFVEISITSGSLVGGVVEYVVHAGDGTDIQSLAGSVHFAAVNKAGTETCTIGTAFGEVVAVSTGTLTNAFTCTTTPTDGIRLQANATSSLTQTALNFLYRVHINSGTATITPQ